MKPSVALVAGARPNFMKIAPVLRAIDQMQPGFEAVLVHTGQHYSPELSDVFFEQLGIRKPDGALTWISVNSQPLFQAEGRTPSGVVVSFQDITERRKTEEALKQATAELARLRASEKPS